MEGGHETSDSTITSRRVAASLIDWFWTEGHQRQGRYRLPVSWIAEAYGHLDTARAAADSLARAKRTCAVWGPSQSGKSTLLSYFIDSASGDDSALCWPGGRPFRFRGSASFDDALNPYNTRSDASACVTRFYASAQVPHPTHPVEVTLSTRRQTLQALAAGYVLECKLERGNRAARDWDADQIRGLLSHASQSPPPIDRSAVEFLLDVVSVVDRLAEDDHARYRKLRSRESEWERALKTALVSDPMRASSLARAETLAFELLWDSNEKLTNLYRELESYRSRTERQFAGRRVFVSLKLASLLLDIEAYPVLTRSGEYDQQRAADLERLVLRMRSQLHDDRAMLDVDDGKDLLFARPEDFGLLQALTWELAVPLRSDFLRGRSEDAANFLETFDVLDVPGVARQYQKASSETLDLDDSRVTRAQLFIQVIKRGKTATIISRHAEQMLVDAVLLLVKGGDFPAQPAQLLGGIRSLWRAYDPSYNPSRGAPPVPMAVCLTMMSQLVDEMAAVGTDKFDASKLEKMIAELGAIASPDISTMFVTTYPHLPVGKFIRPRQELVEKILPAMLAMKWFQDRFRTPLGQGSIRALLQDEDGGVGYLLRSLASLLGKSQTKPIVERRVEALTHALDETIRRALPQRDPDSDRERETLLKLVRGIEQRLQSRARPDELTQAISSDLRRALAFRDKHFESYPESIGTEVDRAVEYLSGQIDDWVSTHARDGVLANFNLSEDEQLIVLRAVQRAIDVDEVASWCVKTFGPVSDTQRSSHIGRYIAAKCAHVAFGKFRKVEAAVESDLNRRCMIKFEQWSKPGRPPTLSPHYEAVIAPHIDILRQMADAGTQDRWEDQAGDAAIEKLFAEWQTGRSV